MPPSHPVQRISLGSHLRDNPSSKVVLPAAIDEACGIARIEAENETGLAEEMFSQVSPWTF